MRAEVEVPVRLLAFSFDPEGAVRWVRVPRTEWDGVTEDTARCELVFYYGQNDHQPKQQRSVSVGDVIELPVSGNEYRVACIGFERLP